MTSNIHATLTLDTLWLLLVVKTSVVSMCLLQPQKMSDCVSGKPIEDFPKKALTDRQHVLIHAEHLSLAVYCQSFGFHVQTYLDSLGQYAKNADTVASSIFLSSMSFVETTLKTLDNWAKV